MPLNARVVAITRAVEDGRATSAHDVASVLLVRQLCQLLRQSVLHVTSVEQIAQVLFLRFMAKRWKHLLFLNLVGALL